MTAPERPGRPWILAMGWQDLLFAHWRVPPEVLSRWIPDPLRLDTFEGEAWLGVVPFRMCGVRPRFAPPLPPVSAFPELNLRTYVTHGGHPGVWFFSLDAASRVAVRMARATFHLPYFDARMTCRPLAGDGIEYTSQRTHRGVVGARLEASYRPRGPVFRSEPGSLEHWLTERYCLYSVDGRGRVFRGDVAHEPWPLQRAEASFGHCDMTRILEWEPARHELPHLLFARRVEVKAAWPERVSRASETPDTPSAS